MKKVFSFFLAAVLSVTVLNAQTVDEILNNYFENVGGIDKWKAMESMKMIGKAPSPQGDFPIMVYSKKPNKIKIVVDIQGKELIPQAFDGEVAWGFNPMAGGTTAQKLPAEATKAISNDADFEPDYINYADKGHEITLEADKEEIDGVECFKVKVVKNKNNDKDESTEYHFFDTENFVPIMYRTTVQQGPSKGTITETYLSDYQETEYGIIMPYDIETRIGGQVGQKIIIEKVEINGDMADDVFAFPETKE